MSTPRTGRPCGAKPPTPPLPQLPTRRLAQQNPGAAGAAARAAADLLHIAAQVSEPAGWGALHDAARAYDRASREMYGRTPHPGPAGGQLRLAAASLALLARAGRDEHAAVRAVAVALAGLVDAVPDLRAAAQARADQAAAARTAGDQLRSAGTAAAINTSSASPARPTAAARPFEPLRRQGLRR